jgi:hypothetical protein
MDHKAACLAEAAACRIKVEADPAIVITGSMKRSNGSNGLSIRQSPALKSMTDRLRQGAVESSTRLVGLDVTHSPVDHHSGKDKDAGANQ